MKVERSSDYTRVVSLLQRRGVVALLGPRQIGKTTLARRIVQAWNGPTHWFDLEDPRDAARLAEPTLALEPLRGLVVLDEVQRNPTLFEILRVLSDREDAAATFLILGSASPDLVQRSSESLAGRVAFHELDGFGLDDVGIDALDLLWLRGGFPRSFLGDDDRDSFEWRLDFVRTFLERDLSSFGVGLPPTTMERFWTMLAHYHGQILNASELGRAFGVSHTTIRKYLDILVGSFVVAELLPWFENVGKRTVKSPKVYVRDTGLLHALLGLETEYDLHRHPKVGASWEGFLLGQVVRQLRARPRETFFWATHAGAELDLLVVRGNRRLGFEFKRTDAPRVTKSMRAAHETLRLDSLTVIHAGRHSFPLAEDITALSAFDIGQLAAL